MNKLLSEVERELPAEGGPRTQASALVGQIRADIIACKLVPGERLRLPELSDRYECGISPLREALARLSSSGFVQLEDQKGFRVSPVSREDLLDLTDVRTEIERMALTRAIRRGDLEWETRVVSAFHRLSRLDPLDRSDSRTLSSEWEAAHQEFHLAMVSACQSRWLLHFRNMLSQQTERYRRLIVSIGLGDRDVAKEHADICDAVLGRNVEHACELITAHFSKTAETVLSADHGNQETRRRRKKTAARLGRGEVL